MFPKRILIKLFIICFCLSLPFYSCKISEAVKAEKKLEKEKIKAEKKRQKEYEDAVKAHYDRQTKKTKARMTQTK